MADSIKIGSLDISAFKVGSDDCKVYLGSTLLYPNQTISYKLVAQYSDSTEYKLECDSSTALTSTEVSSHTTPVTAMTEAVIGGCVKRIDTNAFSGASNITSVTIDNGVEEFGNQAFIHTGGLREMTFPSSLNIIEGSCYRFSGIRRFNNKIPSGVTYLSSGAFADMYSLSAMTIPATVTGSSTNLFLRDSGLTQVHFEGTTPPALGTDAFKNCTALVKIYIPDCDCFDDYKAQSQFSGKTNIIYAENNTKCYVPPHVYFNLSNGAYERGGFSYTADTDNNLTTIKKSASSSGDLTTCKIAVSGVTSIKFTQVIAISGSGFYYSATINGNTVTGYTNSSGEVQEFTGLTKSTTYFISVTLRKKTSGSSISGTNASANITWTQ